MSYIGNSPGVASQRVTTTLTATAAQTQFTTQSGYVLGYVDVYLNGAKLVNGADFEAITGTYITLFAGAAAGDVIELISYVPRGLSDGYTKAEADSKFLDVGGDTATGNLAFATATLSGNLTLNGGTANGVGYLNASKVVTTGSALTFDGTVLATPTLNLTNALGIAYGGTGATTANAALNALLPAQTGNATKYLQTDGTNTTWDAISISTADITGTLPLANGGTGATTAAGALTSLGAYAASNPSGYTTNLGTVTSVGGTGTVNGLTLTGTVSTTGNLTLGGTLDLSAYSAAGAFSTLSASGAVTLSGGTANGVPYLNGSKVVTTGSALTFDGTNLGVGSASYGNAGSINVSVGAPASTIGGLQLWSTTTGNHYVQFGDGTTGSDPYRGAIGYNHNADNLVFYSAGVIGMTLTGSYLYTGSSISVGIGTSNPTAQLEIGRSSTSGYSTLRLSNSGTSGRTYEIGLGGNTAAAGYANNLYFYDSTAAVNRMVLTSAGNLGVGTGTADARLTVIGPAAKLYVDLSGDNYYDAANHVFRNFAGTTRASIGSDGNFFISSATTNTNSSKLVVNGTISQTVGGNQYLVVDQSDVGTAPNQIPLNQYLGSMAFQDRENVNFTGGTGALSSLDIAAVSAQLNVPAVDVFVYDTSKDSDGGAWRKRTQHTSWYNEPLNTAVRGSRREFPAVAVIVATAGSVTIYDGDSPDLPMWMVFTINNSYWLKHSSGGASCVSMLNATLVTGGAGAVGRLSVVEFIADRGNVSEPGYNYVHFNISRRNTDGVGPATGSIFITNISVNDVAMTVLPNAPTDTTTGLPVPTIAVACGSGSSGGVTVINNNGTVATMSGYRMQRVLYDSDNNLYYANDHISGVVGFRIYRAVSATDPTASYYYGHALSETSINVSSGGAPGSGDGLYGFAKSKDKLFLGYRDLVGYRGLNIVDENTSTRALGMVAYVKSNYNTGYLACDIKGAWLSDTTQEAVVGANLIPNGTSFAGATGTTPPTGWTSTGATYTASANVLSITCSAGSNVAATILLTGLIPNKTYQLSMDASSAGYFRVFGTNHDSVRSISGTRTTQVYNIVTTSTALDINILYGSGGASGTLANVSLRLTDADRSVNNLPLLIYGTVTKTPVAVGADLVAYSGWSSSNYLGQPYNSALDFSTSDYFVAVWVNLTSTGSSSQLIDRGDGSTNNNRLEFNVLTGGTLFTNVNASTLSAGTVVANTWQLVCAARRSGVVSHYINGALVGSAVLAGSLSNSSNFLTVGQNMARAGGGVVQGSLSLLRISAKAPSDAQITKMYNDEKYLFQENSKATLYGTSDAVTALAYDDDTQLLHVGTSSGRSVFDGLRRVENTTTAVTSAISAADGLVVEN
jgi:hypothetical protein